MLDSEELKHVIRDLTEYMDPDQEYQNVLAAEQHVNAVEAAKKKELEEAHANLKALTRVLEAARVSSTRPVSVPSEEAHLATLNDLDSSRLSYAKNISDAEAMLANKEAELAALKEEARRLEVYDPALEHEKELDGSTLRLAIYKGIGFEPIVGKDGQVNKMLVRAQSGDVHSVDFTSGKPDHEYTDLLWKLASS
ncbi:hypothetical protein CVT26_003443 [Gymnopilus dilepis]|uniref:Kinetochore protein Spc24 n=1 Tax=Gymnopilus dilepis TaxID=231916 RepID=A0A409VQH0_9AGAR|nr:hypothetical protein CVT26_003443 [Gymnopilus dilepis]